MLSFKGQFGRGAKGLDCAAVKRTLRELQPNAGVRIGRSFGDAAVEALKTFQKHHGLKQDGVFGRATFLKMEPYIHGYARRLYKQAPLRKTHARQNPALPRTWPLSVFRIDNGGFGQMPGSKWGLHPAIVPQVEAICKEFGLQVTAGYGGHPPHAFASDHRVALAVDLAGPYENMVRCNLWADGLRGRVFRWVGGPAHDADGVEPGHYNHDHLSWFRTHPTTIFGTSRFK